MKPSDLPVSSTPDPDLSIAARAAMIPLDRERELEQRALLVAGRILDRQPCDSGRTARVTFARDALRLPREAALEIGIDRKRHCGGDLLQMREDLIDRDPVIGMARRHAKPALVDASALNPELLR